MDRISFQAQIQAYKKIMDEHGLSEERQNKFLKNVAAYSDH
jgi:hypothetical protein